MSTCLINRDAAIDRMFSLLITGDDSGALLLADDALRSGMALDTFLREIMLPVATIVERLHRAAQITAEAYQSVRRLLLRMATQLREAWRRREFNGTSQFVEIRYAQAAVTAAVVDRVIDARASQIIASEVRGAMKALDGRARTIVLDLSDVRILSASGLAMCASIQAEAQARNLRLVIYGLDSESARLLRSIRPAAPGTSVAPAPQVAREPFRLRRLLAA